MKLLVKTNKLLTEMHKTLKRSNRIIMCVNIVNILTIIVLVIMVSK